MKNKSLLISGSPARISAQAAYYILLADYLPQLINNYTTSQIKENVKFRMSHIRTWQDSKMLTNGDKIMFYRGRWMYCSYNF
jgi:hypothetical protein